MRTRSHRNPIVLAVIGLITLLATSARLPWAHSTTLVLAVIGDYGSNGPSELAVSNLVKSWNPDLILSVGDNNYPNGETVTIDHTVGQYYHDYIYPYEGGYGAGSPVNRFFPTLGNHDWYSGDGAAQPYLDYFSLPNNERYYDLVAGPVHFFILDSDDHEPDGIDLNSTQAAWLKSELTSSTAAWQLVFLHHPPYSSGATHGSYPELQWPFQAWGADAVLSGHEHQYERIEVAEFPYFVNGTSGDFTGAFGTPIPESQVRYNDQHGAMRVEASASQIVFQFINEDGLLIDTHILTAPIADTPTPTPTETPTITETPTPTLTESPTSALTATPTQTLSETPTSTPTPSPIPLVLWTIYLPLLLNVVGR